MRKFIVFAIISTFAFSQNLFINDIKVELLDKDTKQVVGEIYEGTPVTAIKQVSDKTLIRVDGEVDDLNNERVALKKEPLLLFYKLNGKKANPSSEFLIATDKLTDNQIASWEDVEMTYYDTCSSCHAAHKPKEHLMNEWEAYLLAMQTFAKIDDEERDRLLRFLQAFAKDGIVKE